MRNSRALRWRKFPTTRPDSVARSPENLSRGMRRAMQRRSNNPQEYGAGRVADVAFPFLVATRSAGEPTIVGNGAAKRNRRCSAGSAHPVSRHLPSLLWAIRFPPPCRRSLEFLSISFYRRPTPSNTQDNDAVRWRQPKECPQCSHEWWPRLFARCDRR